MKLQEYFDNPIRHYILEASLIDWTNEKKYPQSKIAEIRKINPASAVLQYRAKLELRTGELQVPVKSAKEVLAPGSKPYPDSYNPRVIPTPGAEDMMMGYEAGIGTYRTTIKWPNWKNIVRDYMQSYKRNRTIFRGWTKKQIMTGILYNQHVQFDCDCPSFFWQGYKTQLQKVNSAADPYPAKVPSKGKRKIDWIARHRAAGAKPPYMVCKHIRAVLRALSNPESYLMGVIYRELQSDIKFKDLLDALYNPEDDRVTRW